MTATTLSWLPERRDLSARLAHARTEAPSFSELVELANTKINFLRTEQIDSLLRLNFPSPRREDLMGEPIRLAILGSSTTTQLHSGIRVAALRRRFHVDIYEPDYGQYLAELFDENSGLHRFAPNVVLFALDARFLTRSFVGSATRDGDVLTETCSQLRACWDYAKSAFGATVLQQTLLPVFPDLLGQNEHLLIESPAAAVMLMNSALRQHAEKSGVHLVAVDSFASRDGLSYWYSDVFWHQAKQEILSTAAPLYGDLIMRIVGAQYGRSAKCLVLDLDNTIWGGVIGDDGVNGIILGQGSAAGEAFVALQSYARDLARRGVILAVCSKNDEAVALGPFESHPDMVLKRSDIACFVANWDDKASNMRRIASTLSIGLDSIVFVDDNPFERDLVRRELPSVHVPEVPDEPALVARCISDAGYFESIAITAEDRVRTEQYQANAARLSMDSSVTDLEQHLKALEMHLIWSPFDQIGLARIVQLVNKSNQFNLTTRRYNEEELRAFIDSPDVLGLQLRLTDRFGDNGMIAVIILRKTGDEAVVDTWLMSCRVLGRKVEQASLAIIVEQVKNLGVRRLLGEYIATPKNDMVAAHYPKLGFTPIDALDDGRTQRFALDLDDCLPWDGPIHIERSASTKV